MNYYSYELTNKTETGEILYTFDTSLVKEITYISNSSVMLFKSDVEIENLEPLTLEEYETLKIQIQEPEETHQQTEIEILKSQLQMQEQAIAELTMYMFNLGV